MKKIKFILVDDGAAEPRFKVQGSRFSDLKVQSDPRVDDKVQGGFAAVQWAFGPVQGSLTKVRATQGSMTKIKAAGQSGSEREGLIEELCRLRKQYPKAKILGVSELGERCVQPSERMNQLRRELSDLGGGAAGQCGGAAVQVYNIRHHPSGIIHLFRTSPFFEHPPSPSTLKGLHLSLVFSLLRRKKTAPPVALTLW